MVWYGTDVTICVLDFLRSVDCVKMAAVHSHWYRLLRERKMKLCIHRDLLCIPASVAAAIDMFKDWGPVARCL